MTHRVPPTLIESIVQSRRALCVSHVDPDGDAYGSLLGMTWLLRALGNEPVPAMQDPLLEEFRFLPGAADIRGPGEVTDGFDLVICLDASSPDRMGTVYRSEEHGHLPLAVIDHHVTNTGFGTVSWVDPACAATCQMVTYLAEACGVPLDGALAVCLLTGIVTDTLGFRTSNTTPEVLAAAMRLQRGGANLTDIVARTLDRLPFSTLRLWSLVLPTVQIAERVVWVTVSLEHLQQAGQSDREAKLSSVLAAVAEADMAAVFTEKIGENGQPEVKCSLRAKPGFDVGTLALALGGGGHPAASGCTILGTLDEAVGRLVPLLQAARRQQAQDLGL